MTHTSKTDPYENKPELHHEQIKWGITFTREIEDPVENFVVKMNWWAGPLSIILVDDI